MQKLKYKILMFAPYYPPVIGGMETHVFELTKALKNKNMDVSTLSRYFQSPSKWETIWFYFKSIFKIALDDVDLVHAHDIHAGIALSLSKIINNKPNVITVHSSNFLKNYKKHRFFYSKMLNSHDAVITVSKEIMDVCKQLTKTDVHYISNGIDTEKFKPEKSQQIQKEFGIPENKEILITVRRLVPKNNVLELAVAFEQVLKKHDSYLVIIGDGEQKKQIEALNNDRIILAGFRDNKIIQKYLNSSDVFVIPSLMEATSISCLEAMSCGLPIVATNVGGLPDLIHDNGYLCEPNAKSISDNIIKILDEDLKKMGKQSRKIVLEKFSWDRIVKKYLNVYVKVMKK